MKSREERAELLIKEAWTAALQMIRRNPRCMAMSEQRRAVEVLEAQIDLMFSDLAKCDKTLLLETSTERVRAFYELNFELKELSSRETEDRRREAELDFMYMRDGIRESCIPLKLDPVRRLALEIAFLNVPFIERN